MRKSKLSLTVVVEVHTVSVYVSPTSRDSSSVPVNQGNALDAARQSRSVLAAVFHQVNKSQAQTLETASTMLCSKYVAYDSQGA